MQGLTIVLSGRLPNSTNVELGRFWKSFIEVQRAIPQTLNIENIFAHSCSINQLELIQMAYAPNLLIEEENKVPQLEGVLNLRLNKRLNTGNNFQKVIKNYSNLKNIFLDIMSRSKALDILDDIPDDKVTSRVLILDWRALSSRGRNNREICIDASLPEEFIYMEYNKQIDLGYYDDWILTSWTLAKELSNFSDYSNDFFEKNSSKILDFKPIEWPWFYYKNFLNILFLPDKTLDFILSIKMKARYVHKNFLNRDLFSRFIYKLATFSLNILDSPTISVETSFMPNSKLSEIYIKAVFGKIERSKLAKSFISSDALLKNNLRLLTKSDFSLAPTSGQCIAAQKIILIIELKLEQNILDIIKNGHQFLLPLEKLFVIRGEFIFEVQIGRSGKMTNNIGRSVRKLGIKNKLNVINKDLKSLGLEDIPILFLDSFSIERFCDDWIYLNSLLKFFRISKKRLVVFSNSIRGMQVDEFPDLETHANDQDISLQNMILSCYFLESLAKSICNNGKFKALDLDQSEKFHYISGKKIFGDIS